MVRSATCQKCVIRIPTTKEIDVTDPQKELLIQRKIQDIREIIENLPKEQGVAPAISFDIRGSDPITLEAIRRMQEEAIVDLMKQRSHGEHLTADEIERLREEIRTLTKGPEENR